MGVSQNYKKSFIKQKLPKTTRKGIHSFEPTKPTNKKNKKQKTKQNKIKKIPLARTKILKNQKLDGV
jgi:hypothetical protein